MADVKSLIAQRGGRRAYVAVLLGKLEEIMSVYPICKDSISEAADELKRQQDLLFELDNRILPNIAEGEMEKEIKKASEITMKISTAIKRALSAIKEPDTTAKVSSVKLPYINLIKFSGDPLEWNKFWDIYRSAIHIRTDISSAAKFNYLTTQLEGEASRLLGGFDNTSAEYEDAIQLLTETYGRPKILIRARLDALFDLKTPQPTATGISDYRATYEGHVRALSSMGCNIEAAGYVYAELLLRKLPTSTRDHINRTNKTDSWDLQSLRQAISDEIGYLQASENSQENKVKQEKQEDWKTTKINNIYDNSSTSDQKSAAFAVSANKVMYCAYCSKNHLSINCLEYKTIDKRKERVASLKLCYNCLRPNHSVFNCLNSNRCRHCGRKHHSSLCKSIEVKSQKSANKLKDGKTPKSSVQVGAQESNTTTSGTVHSKDPNCSSILPTAILSISNGNTVSKCKSLFDLGSQRTFVTKKFVDNLKLKPVASIPLCIDGFESQGETKNYNVVNLDVLTPDEVIQISAVVVDSIPSRLNMQGRINAVKNLQQQGINLADPSVDTENYKDLSVLIGVDHYFKFTYDNPLGNGLFAIPSKLGCLIAGTIPVANTTTSSVTTVLKVASVENSNVGEDIRHLSALEQIGISVDNSNDELAITKFKNSITYSDNKYVARLPWKDNCPKLPTNKFIAKKRLDALLGSLEKKPDQLEKYDKMIREQEQLGFIERVTEDNLTEDRIIHYIPHHPVFKDSETTPMRIVYDCSCKANKHSPSLNDCLLTGPSLLNDLAAILLRFRLGAFACSSDISKAFLMVGLNEADRDSCRFYWPVNPFSKNREITTYRFRVVLFGSTSSQFLLNCTVKHHLKQSDNKISDAIARNIYVDNLQNTFDNENEMINFYSESKKIMSEAGFALKTWVSNSDKLNNLSTIHGDSSKNQSNVKILGIHWNTKLDHLSVPKSVSPIHTVNKRSIVSFCAKIFDPLGWILPVSINCKMFIQKLWKNNCEWDMTLSDELIAEWRSLESNLLTCLNNFTIKRMLSCKRNVKLHVFGDASKFSFGAVAYIADGKNVDFLIAKSRLAPIKSPSLPQMELTALEIAARISSFICDSYSNEFSIECVYLWTDSQICTHWISDCSRAKPYVKQRVQSIKKLAPSAKVLLVPGTMNPADILTRGLKASQFINSAIWHCGPTWLNGNWPDTSISNHIAIEIPQDDKINTVVNQINNSESSVILPYVTNSYFKILRVTAYVLRFISNIRKRISGVRNRNCNVTEGSRISPLSCKEIREAEALVLKIEQQDYYKDVHDYFNEPSKLKKPIIVKQLNLFVAENLIRSKGRYERTHLPHDSKYPILLSEKSILTKLIIKDYHFRNLHAGTNELLAAVRGKFWIPRARSVVKSVIRNCTNCLKVQGKPYQSPPTPPFPVDRITKLNPFQITGVDYTGAITVRNNGNSCKCYLILFTCAITRAVHIEVAEDCSEQEFLRAMTRFSSRRSFPSVMYSDNATYFVAASKSLSELISHPSVNNYLLHHRIQWKFITPRAAWHGGMWERLIGIMKNCFKKVVGNSLISRQELQTLATQIEARMNDRPLTYITDDIRDYQPLTPSHLLHGFRLTEFPAPIDLEEIKDSTFQSHDKLTKRQLHLNLLLENCWKRWQTEYLLALRERYNYCTNIPIKCPKLGEVVLIHDDKPRVFWKLGLIVKLIKGHDGFTRSVSLRTGCGNITRPITKLYPLEISAAEPIHMMAPAEQTTVRRIVPQRVAAAEALRKIRESET